MALSIKLYKPDSGGSGGSEGTQFISLEVTDDQLDGVKAVSGEVPKPGQDTTTKGTHIVDRGFNSILLTFSGKVSAYGGQTAVQRRTYLINAFRTWWNVGTGSNKGKAYLIGLSEGTYRVSILSITLRQVYPEVAGGEQVSTFVLRLKEML